MFFILIVHKIFNPTVFRPPRRSRVPRPYALKQHGHALLYAAVEYHQHDGRQDERYADGLANGKRLAEHHGAYAHGRHRLERPEYRRQRAADAAHGHEQRYVRYNRRRNGQQHDVYGRHGVGQGLHAVAKGVLDGEDERRKHEHVERKLAAVHVPHARLVHGHYVTGIANGRQQHDDKPDGAQLQSRALQRQPRHAAYGQHNGQPRHPRRLLPEDGEHYQRNEHGVSEMYRRGDARPHHLISVKQEQRRGRVEHGQQHHHRQVAPADGERLALGQHHQSQRRRRHQEAVKQD